MLDGVRDVGKWEGGGCSYKWVTEGIFMVIELFFVFTVLTTCVIK